MSSSIHAARRRRPGPEGSLLRSGTPSVTGRAMWPETVKMSCAQTRPKAASRGWNYMPSGGSTSIRVCLCGHHPRANAAIFEERFAVSRTTTNVPGRPWPSSPPSVHGRGVVLPRRRVHLRRHCFFSVGCITRIVPMSQVALSRTTGKPGIGGSRAVLTGPLLPTGRTSQPRGTMTVIAPMWVWATISTSQSSNSAWLKSIVTGPIPVSILVRRLTCQRPLGANLAYRGRDLQRLLTPPRRRSEFDGRRQAANHRGEVSPVWSDGGVRSG